MRVPMPSSQVLYSHLQGYCRQGSPAPGRSENRVSLFPAFVICSHWESWGLRKELCFHLGLLASLQFLSSASSQLSLPCFSGCFTPEAPTSFWMWFLSSIGQGQWWGAQEAAFPPPSSSSAKLVKMGSRRFLRYTEWPGHTQKPLSLQIIHFFLKKVRTCVCSFVFCFLY